MGPFMFPEFDPVIFSIPVPFTDLALPIRWYAMAYLSALLITWRYCMYLTKFPPRLVSAEQIDDLAVWATLGVILGGRLGFVIFYQPGYFLENPILIPQVWTGGMSFHGGLLGVTLAMVLFARKRGIALLGLADLVSAVAPIGQLLGRIANFINGELWGRVTDVPWGVIFPNIEPYGAPRHPSQLYHAGLEGLALLLIQIFLVFGPVKALRRPGLLTGTWIAGYAVVRIFLEQFREPDAYVGYLVFGTTWGQWLSLPLLAGGVYLIARALRRAPSAAADG